MTHDGDGLDVGLLDECFEAAKAAVSADPALSGTGHDPALLQLRLAHAVIEGAKRFGNDSEQIIAFALDALPPHREATRRLGCSGAIGSIEPPARVPPPVRLVRGS